MKARLVFFVTVFLFKNFLIADDDHFRVKPILEVQSKDLIRVGSDWLKCPKRLKVSLRVGEIMPSNKVFVRAYFYDAAKKLVYKYGAPCNVWTSTPKGIEEVGLPQTLEPGKDVEVYFALPDELEAKKWKYALVVFGNQNEASARSKPQGAMEDFEFPEKAFTKME